MSSYREAFPKGCLVSVRDRAFLQEFRRTWRFHHPLQPSQLAHAGAVTKVLGVSFYHGGDVLYTLDGIDGIWHEACLMQHDAG